MTPHPPHTPLHTRHPPTQHQPLLRRPLAAVAAASPPRDNDDTEKAAKAKAKNKRVYDWKDPLLIRGQLTEEERMIQEMAQAYCQQSLMPR